MSQGQNDDTDVEIWGWRRKCQNFGMSECGNVEMWKWMNEWMIVRLSICVIFNLLKDSSPTWHCLHLFRMFYGNFSVKQTTNRKTKYFSPLSNIFIIINNKTVDIHAVTGGEWCWQHCYLYASDNEAWKLEFYPLSGHFLRSIYSIQPTISYPFYFLNRF